jgi:RHS repeat-associated protein
MTSDETGKQFVYDAWNRLVVVKNSGGSTLATYQYDGLDRRVRDIEATTTDLYYSDQWQVLEERVGGTPYASYVWSPVYVDALIARDRDGDGNSANGLEERLYAMQDVNWNVVGLVNASGTVVERYAYDSFGGFTILDGSWGSRSSSSYAWVYLFEGGRWNAAIGGFDFRNRDLSATLGRWLQLDPARFEAADVNLYRSEGNDPAGCLDPYGLTKFEIDQCAGTITMEVTIDFVAFGKSVNSDPNSTKIIDKIIQQVESVFNSSFVGLRPEVNDKCCSPLVPKLKITPGTGAGVDFTWPIFDTPNKWTRWNPTIKFRQPRRDPKTGEKIDPIEIWSYPAAEYFAINFLKLQGLKTDPWGSLLGQGGVSPWNPRDLTNNGSVMLPRYYGAWLDELNKQFPTCKYKAGFQTPPFPLPGPIGTLPPMPLEKPPGITGPPWKK